MLKSCPAAKSGEILCKKSGNKTGAYGPLTTLLVKIKKEVNLCIPCHERQCKDGTHSPLGCILSDMLNT